MIYDDLMSEIVSPPVPERGNTGNVTSQEMRID